MGGLVFFTASSTGRLRWATDGTVASTALVSPILTNVGGLAAAFGGLAFSIDTATTGGPG